MQQTSNYALKKPEQTDVVNIEDLNTNFDTLDTELKKVSDKANFIQTAGGTGTAITLNNVSLVNGFTVTFVVAANNSGAATTINGKALYKPGGTSAPTLTAGKAVTVWYNGTNFFIKASAEGDAVAANVLAGKTFSNDVDTGLIGTIASKAATTYNPSTSAQTIAAGQYLSGAQTVAATTGTSAAGDVLSGKTFNSANGIGLTGTMPNNGSVGTQTLTTEGAEYTIPAGYHNGSGKVKAAITGLIASVIKAGTTVGGILGTFTADATATAAQMLSGVTAYVNGNKVTGTIVSRGSEEYQGWRRAEVSYASEIGRVHLRIPTGAYLTGTAAQGGQLGVFCDDPNFIPDNFLATKNIFGLQGGVPNRDYIWSTAVIAAGWIDNNNIGIINIVPPTGYYSGNPDYMVHGGVQIANSDYIPQNILSGKNIWGIAGTAKRVASGSAPANGTLIPFTYADGSGTKNCASFTASGLTFKPSIIFAEYEDKAIGYKDIVTMSYNYYLARYTVCVHRFNDLNNTAPSQGGYDPYQFLLDGTNAYVTSNGFRLPSNSAVLFSWTAIE